MTKEISAEEARKKYQKSIDTENQIKLDQIYDMIHKACAKQKSIEVLASFMNDTILDKLRDLEYHVIENPLNFDDLPSYTISWS